MIFKRTEGVMLTNLNAPPVNALGLKIRQALSAAINELDANQQIKAIGLYSALPLFYSGADIVEFRTGIVWDKPDLCVIIENSSV